MFDLVVLGGGPGGYHAALQAAHKGLSVALVEKNEVGGVCLNEGCVPTKTLLNSGKLLSTKEGFGVLREKGGLDIAALQERKESIIATLRKSIQSSLKNAGVTTVTGVGILSKSHDVFDITVNDETLAAKSVIVATGSTAVIPPIPGHDQDFVYTSRELLSLESIPKHLVVVGGGVIGLEMANFYADCSAQVTIIEALPNVGGALDKDVEKVLTSTFKKKGITLYTKTKVLSIGDHSITAEGSKGNIELDCDAVLLSVGRRSNVTGYGLEELDVVIDRDAIATDECCETNIKGLYAVGDVNGKWLLAHTAYREAEIAVDAILGNRQAMPYDVIPSVIYTSPEVASVGLTEALAAEKGIEVVVKKRPLGGNGRFLAETHKERGLCKVLLSPEGLILGVQMVGLYASELINAAAILVQLKVTKEQVAQLILPHPTVGEIIKEIILEG